jgi:hypothetical protein
LATLPPDVRDASSGTLGQQVVDFKQIVQTLHAAGLEVILNVLYNHTATPPVPASAVSPRSSRIGITRHVLTHDMRWEQEPCLKPTNCSLILRE